MKQQPDAEPGPIVETYERLARDFESAAETFRQVHLHGPANDAEAKKGACESLRRRERPMAAQQNSKD